MKIFAKLVIILLPCKLICGKMSPLYLFMSEIIAIFAHHNIAITYESDTLDTIDAMLGADG